MYVLSLKGDVSVVLEGHYRINYKVKKKQAK